MEPYGGLDARKDWNQMASRKIEDLHPWMQVKANLFKECLDRKKVPYLIYCTWRSGEEQDTLKASGRSRASAGQSAHQYGLAFDAAPLDVRGEPIWAPHPDTMRELYNAAEHAGLDAYGEKHGAYAGWDLFHFEEPGAKYLFGFLQQEPRGGA